MRCDDDGAVLIIIYIANSNFNNRQTLDVNNKDINHRPSTRVVFSVWWGIK